MNDLYEVVIEHENLEKRLYTLADSEQEAGEKFGRHLICQWVGYPAWDVPETLLEQAFDKLENGATI